MGRGMGGEPPQTLESFGGIGVQTLAVEGLLVFTHENHAPHRFGRKFGLGKKQRTQDAATAVAEYGVAIAFFHYKAKTANPIRAVDPLQEQVPSVNLFAFDGDLPIVLLREQPECLQRSDSAARRLLFVDRIADGEALAALGTTTIHYGLAPTVFHTCTETLLVGALAVVGLKCSFHGITF